MELATVMLVLLALFIVGIVLLGFYHPKSGADVLGWQADRGPERAEIDELEDLAQLLEATNAKRRARGRPERTVQDVENELRGG